MLSQSSVLRYLQLMLWIIIFMQWCRIFYHTSLQVPSCFYTFFHFNPTTFPFLMFFIYLFPFFFLKLIKIAICYDCVVRLIIFMLITCAYIKMASNHKHVMPAAGFCLPFCSLSLLLFELPLWSLTKA